MPQQICENWKNIKTIIPYRKKFSHAGVNFIKV